MRGSPLRIRRSVTLTTAAVLQIGAALPAVAQTPPPALPPGTAVRPIQDPGQQLIDEQRRRARQRQLAQPPASVSIAPSTEETTLDISADTPVDQIVEKGPTFEVRQIVLTAPGNAPFVSPSGVPQAKLDAIVAPFSAHALGSHRINVLLKRLTDAFVEAGYVTTRALLGPQNLGSGTLTVTVQVGHIGAYTVNGQPIHRLKTDEKAAGGGWLTDAGYENAFPAAPGDPLRLEDIDQGVSQINRLRRNQATVQVLPGQSAGDSVVDIRNRSGDGVYYSLGVDNYGSSATGVTRYRAGLEADNLIGLQESLSLNFIDSTDSNALVGSFAVPFGRHTFSYTLSDSEYQEVVGTSVLLYGRTLSHILGWNYALDRTQADIVNLDATLSWRRTDRQTNGIGLDPERIAVLRAGGNWLHKFVLNDAPGSVTLDAGLSQGLPWLEADHNKPNIARTDAHGQFTKFDATATFTVPLPPLGRAQLAYRGVLGGQYTNVALYGSEQLYLGGMDTVRGFRSGEIAGDRGIYSRNELAWVNAPAWPDGRIEPYVFFDAGKASLVAMPGFPSLVGAGFGVRTQWQWHRQLLSGELLAGRALTQPAALGSKATLILGTINWTY
ncbi:ShlB/FhaC/HecB family hemolysin secretion/activation protein [Paraburkholderia antibiotica]|uniref:ShlB/FhaC/HecB family hemolysin secretion/activation protein n=1 Tax=Paraburkholderia antibiotica TaxID=2728839 RepID=A0A7Y0A2A8_9BURK|nr:ShlB/FhaC/HecB family hemolysin secretion/activation protein [Paraburkholderia antibiotica]NML35220.1 ShlB/FhaC/HecB family hemolysin secretion/activation protein [Paraburkholderia antibiotica]